MPILQSCQQTSSTQWDWNRRVIALLDPAYNILAEDVMRSMEGKSNVIQHHTSTQKYTRKGPPQIHISMNGALRYSRVKHIVGSFWRCLDSCPHHVENCEDFIHIMGGLWGDAWGHPHQLRCHLPFHQSANWRPLKLLSWQFNEDSVRLFNHVLIFLYTCICFNGQFYEQMDGVVMGSLLSTVIASLFTENFKEEALSWAAYKTYCWFCYVDVNFMI